MMRSQRYRCTGQWQNDNNTPDHGVHRCGKAKYHPGPHVCWCGCGKLILGPPPQPVAS